MTKDPVCAMEIDEQTASWSSVHKEKSYYFCSAGCKDKFDKEPDKFLPQKKIGASFGLPGKAEIIHDEGDTRSGYVMVPNVLNVDYYLADLGGRMS